MDSKRAVHDKNKEVFKSFNKAKTIQQHSKPRPTPSGQGYKPSVSALQARLDISMHCADDLAEHYNDFVVTDGIGREQELLERLRTKSAR